MLVWGRRAGQESYGLAVQLRGQLDDFMAYILLVDSFTFGCWLIYHCIRVSRRVDTVTMCLRCCRKYGARGLAWHT